MQQVCNYLKTMTLQISTQLTIWIKNDDKRTKPKTNKNKQTKKHISHHVLNWLIEHLYFVISDKVQYKQAPQ